MERLEYKHDEYAAQVLAARYGRTPRVHLRNFGCQQNINEGERIEGVLIDIGFELEESPSKADLILFNTCAVREHAEQRVFGHIGTLKAYKKANPKLIIGICGCMSEEQSTVDKIKASYPYVDMVLGTNIADKLPTLLIERLTTRKRALRKPVQRDAIVENIPHNRGSNFKAFLPIMYGCDNFCSYCIVPHVRGRERSRESAEIIKEFESLVNDGYKEITLLGQNVNSYGKGLDEKVDFSDLLELLCKTPGNYRIRFLTSHPKDATRKMIDTIAANPQICKHLHLPVQSGSNDILAKMNRNYTAESYLSLINYAKKTCPDITFSSDIIVGFPSETQEDFDKTVELVNKVGYTQLFTFIFSKRTGTKAAELPDNTPHKVKAERVNYLIALQEENVKKVSAPWMGKTFTALVEGIGREEGMQIARLDNNMVVQFEAEQTKPLKGKFISVKIEALQGAILKGSLVDVLE